MAFEDLVGKTVAITGGAGVIGHALAHGLAANGLNIAILDLDEEGPKSCQRARREARHQESRYRLQCPRKTVDRKRPRHLSRLFWPVPFPDQWGWGKQSQGINEYRTNPGRWHRSRGSFFELPESQFRFTLDLNLMGTVLPTQILGPQILKQERGYSQHLIDECLPSSDQNPRLLGRQMPWGISLNGSPFT